MCDNQSCTHTHTAHQVTYADFEFYIVSGDVLRQVPTLLENFPTLAKLRTSVEQLPNIAKWLKERPETQF